LPENAKNPAFCHSAGIPSLKYRIPAITLSGLSGLLDPTEQSKPTTLQEHKMKNGYQVYDETTAPLASSGLLNEVRLHYGFIPNALGAMAVSSKALEAYMILDKMVRETSFSNLERNIVLLTVTREGDCSYCVAAHSAFAKMDKVPEAIIQSLRDDRPLTDPRLEALHRFAARVVTQNGSLDESEVSEFLDAGFTREQALEVILIHANKVIAMQANRVMGTDLDQALTQSRWSRVA